MDYIERVLGLELTRQTWKGKEKLPYFMLESYSFEAVKIGEHSCLFVKPNAKIASMATLKKHVMFLKEKTGWVIVFELDTISSYRKTAFIKEKIPFVVPDRQIYLPFIGIVQQERGPAEDQYEHVEKLIPSAQMLLFDFILGHCRGIFISEAAERFDMTPMSISRATKQLEKAGLVRRESRGTRKYIISDESPKALFDRALGYLINPVRKVIFINRDEMRGALFDAGLSALSKRGMLSPPATEVYGTAQSETDFVTISTELMDDSRQIVLELWRYDPTLISRGHDIDPLSLYMSLIHLGDERVEQALDNMLKEAF